MKEQTKGPFKFVGGPRDGQIWDHDITNDAVELRVVNENSESRLREYTYGIDHNSKELRYKEDIWYVRYL